MAPVKQHRLRRFDARPLAGDVRVECTCGWAMLARRPAAIEAFRLHQDDTLPSEVRQ